MIWPYLSDDWNGLYSTDDNYEAILERRVLTHGLITHVADEHGNRQTISYFNHELARLSYALMRCKSNPETESLGVLQERSFIYLGQSGALGINYLPHPYRARYIVEHSLLGDVYDRLAVVNAVDNELKLYYDHLNEMIRRNAFHCTYPILYDYIRKNANDLNGELRAALEIRNDKDVIAFRKQLALLDAKVNSGNVEALSNALKQIQDLASQIMNSFCKKVELGELSLGLSPTFNFPIQFTKKKKEIKLTFLSRLIDFGIHERLKR